MMTRKAEDEEEIEWHEINAWYKQRHREHVQRNMSDYEKYVDMMRLLGFSNHAVGAGIRFSHANGRLRIDFWKQSGKWTVVGTNKYNLGPKKMVKFAKERLEEGTIPPLPTPPKHKPRLGVEPAWDSNPDTPPWEV